MCVSLQDLETEDRRKAARGAQKRKQPSAGGSVTGAKKKRSRRPLVLVPAAGSRPARTRTSVAARHLVAVGPPGMERESQVLRGRIVRCTWTSKHIVRLGLRYYHVVHRTGMASLLTTAWSGEADRRFYTSCLADSVGKI